MLFLHEKILFTMLYFTLPSYLINWYYLQLLKTFLGTIELNKKTKGWSYCACLSRDKPGPRKRATLREEDYIIVNIFYSQVRTYNNRLYDNCMLSNWTSIRSCVAITRNNILLVRLNFAAMSFELTRSLTACEWNRFYTEVNKINRAPAAYDPQLWPFELKLIKSTSSLEPIYHSLFNVYHHPVIKIASKTQEEKVLFRNQRN